MRESSGNRNQSYVSKLRPLLTSSQPKRAVAGIVASGSATLEAAYFRMPFALIYKVAWPTYLAGRLLVKVKYLGMPNVLADKQVVPEFIQHRARPKDLAKALAQLLDNPMARERMISEFDKIAVQLGELGASARAAKAILSLAPFLDGACPERKSKGLT
ncbi:MAG: hypothetical protein DME41_10340 [Verrucomicrobia bacterium]|nr:MAG: hypothetical protein DME41_10340 [Verrucomicrobiota bacterium]